MLGKINWNPNIKQMRWFGAIFLAGFYLLALLMKFKGHITAGYWLLLIGGVGGVWALALPKTAKPLYVTWMAIGMAIGAVVSRVVMGIIFFLILTPVALIFRYKKRDALLIRPENREKSSYWETHPEINDKKYYEHLF